jgi:hypothetical protein
MTDIAIRVDNLPRPGDLRQVASFGKLDHNRQIPDSGLKTSRDLSFAP